jgi:hypothetical protein
VYLLFKGGSGVAHLDSFQFASNAPPAAPTRLSVQSGSGQIGLTWTDNSGDETGFQVERSTDGVNFQAVATVAANVTSYTDASMPPDAPGTRTTYSYRVRATGAPGNSAASNVASGIASLRDAFSPIQAESYDTMSGIYNATGSDIGGLDAGDWAAYYNVNFGAGATTFQCAIGVPYGQEGQQVEVHLDSPTSPAVGVLTMTATGSWYFYTVQLAPVNGVSGVHDVYLVFGAGSGSGYGIGDIDWFDFANPPAS